MTAANDGSNKLLFLHIPKTAGSSLTRILKSNFRKKKIFHQMDPRELEKHLEAGDCPQRLYIGHYGYDLVNRFKVRPKVLTVLRDPRQRVISHYYFYRAYDEAALGPWEKKIAELCRRHDFRTFITLDVPEIEQSFSNLQTRQLASTTDCRVPADGSGRRNLLAEACEHLELLDFVGIVEEFERSLELLAHQFGIYRRFKTVSENVNPARVQREDDLKIFDSNEIAHSRVALDEELYSVGKQLFESACQQMPEQPISFGQRLVNHPLIRKLVNH